jgi:hypothetical protein
MFILKCFFYPIIQYNVMDFSLLEANVAQHGSVTASVGLLSA